MAAPSPLEQQQLGVAATPTYWHRVRFELVAREASAGGCDQVLDFGAGSGLLGDYLRANHPELSYSFTETSPLLRARLVDQFGRDADVTLGERIPARTMVVMLDVLEHIEDDVAALDALRRRMQPSSRLIVTVPAMPWAYSSWDVALGHFRRYTRAQVADRLHRAGFSRTTSAYLFPELSPLLLARRLRRAPRTSADFPQLGRFADALGYRIASLTTAARRLWPFGTSVVAVATREQ